MTRFLPCPSCNRHVNGADARCPFCETVMPRSEPRPAGSPPLVRLGRIAVLAAGAALAGGNAGCADSPKKTDAGTGGQTAAGGHDSSTGTGGGAGSGTDAGTGGNTATDAGQNPDAPVPVAIYAAAIALRSNKA